jgi:hypothetical protein
MSHKPATSRKLRSHIDKFAPNTSSKDEFKVEEFPSSDLVVILAEFQGGNKSTSTAGGVEGTSRENVVIEDDVVRHGCQPCDADENMVVAAILADFQGGSNVTPTSGGVEGLGSDLLFCQPCDEDENVEVVAEGKTNSRSKRRKRGMTVKYYDDDGEEDYDEDDEDYDEDDASWDGDSNEDENVEVVAEGKTNSRSKKRKRGTTKGYSDDGVDDNDENDGSWNGDGNSATWHLCKDCDYKTKQIGNLKQHRAFVHNENVTWHKCEDCDYKAKREGDLKKHRAAIHNENVTWHQCKDCDFKAKLKCTIKRHRAAIHNENVTWYYCTDCDYKAKQRSNLKKHRARIHK